MIGNVILAEFAKNKRSNIIWLTFLAFSLAPLMGGVFMIIMKNPDAVSGALKNKIEVMGFGSNWASYFEILTQAIGVGGVLVFGFVSSWIFGREYTEGTAKDLLALPSSRMQILNAKFFLYITWCIALALSNLLIGSTLGLILNLPGAETFNHYYFLENYFITAILTIFPGTVVAFFALWGKGYLAPLGFVALALVFSQVIAAIGYGNYFPWAIPGLYSGAGGIYREDLNVLSYTILVITSFVGYLASLLHVKHANHFQ